MANGKISYDVFWNFSNDIYTKSGVQDTCLQLQDNYKANVNIILLCLWHCRNGRSALTREDLSGLSQDLDEWQQNVIQPLRATRRKLKGGIAPITSSLSKQLREKIKFLELEAERAEQEFIQTSFSLEKQTLPNQLRAASAAIYSLNQYFAILEIHCISSINHWTLVLVSAAFPDISTKDLRKICLRGK